MFHYVDRSGFKLCFCLVVCYMCSMLVVAELTEDLIPVLYLKYRDAFNGGESSISVRRLYTNNKQYEIHVKRLKQVNGFKPHNLLIKETLRSNENPLIYINNPVESKLPNSYLTLEEFKNALTNRIQLQKDELAAKRNRVLKMKTIKRPKVTKTVSKKHLKNIMPHKKSKRPEINNKVEKSTTKGIVKQIIKESTKNLRTKAVKQIMTSVKIKKQNKTDIKMQNTVENKPSNKILNGSRPTLKSTSLLMDGNVSSLKTRAFSKNYTEAKKIKQITDITQPLKHVSLSLKPKLETTTILILQNNNKKEETTKLFDKEINMSETRTITSPMNITNTRAITSPMNISNTRAITSPKNITNTRAITSPMNITNKRAITSSMNITTTGAITSPINITNTRAISSSMSTSSNTETKTITTKIPLSNISTIVINVTNTIYPETSTTTEITTFNTIELKIETPKRSTGSKTTKGNKRLDKKPTKTKRSTLGRPMVFME